MKTTIKTWIITRHIIEKMCGHGETKEEALRDAEDPFSVTIIKETIEPEAVAGQTEHESQ